MFYALLELIRELKASKFEHAALALDFQGSPFFWDTLYSCFALLNAFKIYCFQII